MDKNIKTSFQRKKQGNFLSDKEVTIDDEAKLRRERRSLRHNVVVSYKDPSDHSDFDTSSEESSFKRFSGSEHRIQEIKKERKSTKFIIDNTEDESTSEELPVFEDFYNKKVSINGAEKEKQVHNKSNKTIEEDRYTGFSSDTNSDSDYD
ncbi:uncharacterized protein LOC135119866 [Zophobas morio]|uniref:uncharacterized protein LOC135119866 n=1 Tax=Zophobas morio TaxID=2755281 RepID=UPI003083A59E